MGGFIIRREGVKTVDSAFPGFAHQAAKLGGSGTEQVSRLVWDFGLRDLITKYLGNVRLLPSWIVLRCLADYFTNFRAEALVVFGCPFGSLDNLIWSPDILEIVT